MKPSTTSALLPSEDSAVMRRSPRPRVNGEFTTANQLLGQSMFFQWKQPLLLGNPTPEKPTASPSIPNYTSLDPEK